MAEVVDLPKLKQELNPFSFSGTVENSDLASSYFRFYGLDFENHFSVQHRFGYVEGDEFNIALHYFCPVKPRGTVFVVHGYYDHVGIYTHLIEYFLSRNYAVVSYDQPGHGLSTGERSSIDSFSQYVEVLQHCLSICGGNCSGPFHIVGQSMAGSIIMTYLLQNRYTNENCPFDRIVLLAPLVHPSGWWIGRWIHGFGKYFIKQQARSFVVNTHDGEFLEFLENRDSLQSTILPMRWVTSLKAWIRQFHLLPTSLLSVVVIQGTDDQTVDWPYNMKVIEEKFPNLTIHYLTGARHQLVNESEPYRKTLFDRMDAFF